MRRWRAVFATAILIVIVLLLYRSEAAHVLYERLSIATFPNAHRALAYGDRHFSSQLPDSYDIDLADKLYRTAVRLDPNLPRVYHQIARIAFLRGQNNLALIAIDIEIEKSGDSLPNSYYVRGLIEGFMGDYTNAIADYRKYLQYDLTNWAATNDLAWVLLRADRPKEVIEAIDRVLPIWPKNPWLLNSYAIAMHELGRDEEAEKNAQAAADVVKDLTPEEWLRAYPGNDPRIAFEGVRALKKAVTENIHTIELALQKGQKNVR